MRVKTGSSASLAASHATTKAPRKLFFNLRGMRSGEHALTQAEAKRIAKELNVKPEEVFEMNMRLSGRDIAMDARRTTVKVNQLRPRLICKPTSKCGRLSRTNVPDFDKARQGFARPFLFVLLLSCSA